MSVYLDREHGVAPALMVCPLCGKDTNGIALLGMKCRNLTDAQGNKMEYGWGTKVMDSQPCDNCKKLLDGGATAFVEVTSEADRTPTGRAVMLTEEATQRIFNGGEQYRGKITHIGKDVMDLLLRKE